MSPKEKIPREFHEKLLEELKKEWKEMGYSKEEIENIIDSFC